MLLFRENYARAFDNNQTLFDLVKNQPAYWNPAFLLRAKGHLPDIASPV